MAHHSTRHLYKPAKQQGVILIVALVMLLIMTSLGVTTITGATLQERMASNSRQQYLARLNAERGLRAGETYLDGLSLGTMVDDSLGLLIDRTTGFYPVVQVGSTPSANHNINLIDAGSWVAGTNSIDSNIADAGVNNPLYIIEYMGLYDQYGTQGITVINSKNTSDLPYIFRVSAIGWGDSANAFSVLQSYYISP